MSMQALLEIAIGLVFTWLVLSLAAMYLQDWIVTALRWRSSLLEAAIRNLLGNDQELTEAFYNHPLIQSLHSGKKGARFFDKFQRPSYIPSSHFSLALFDIIITAGTEASVIQKHMQTLRSLEADIEALSADRRALARQELDLALDLARHALDSDLGAAAVQKLEESIKDRLVQMAIKFPEIKPGIENLLKTIIIDNQSLSAAIEIIQHEYQDGHPEPDVLKKIQNGLAVLGAQHPVVQKAIKTLITGVEEYAAQGETALARARKQVEQWFDNSMDRLSGWYKRRMQVLSLVIGLLLAISFNVDTFQITTYLWRDPILRQALATQAEMYIRENEQGIRPTDAAQLYQLQLELSQLNVPIGWIGTPLPATSGGGVPQGDGTERRCTMQPRSTIDLFGFVVGNMCYPLINTPTDLTGWFIKVIGLFVTGMATAQGAPFWFDVLKRVINLRTSGAKPASSGG
ncbi:MAG: hypothetical protein WHV44_08820 [Anaerolineales bacterium]